MDERILVVDDEKDICEILGFNLSNEGYRVDTATSAEEALRKLTPEHALILLDVMMGGMSGFAMAKKLTAGPGQREGRLVFGDVTIDFDTKEVIIGPHAIPLTRTEFDILTTLASNPARVFSREDLIDRIWKDAPFVTERTVDVHITRLRKKLGAKASLISSRPGYGYRFNYTEE